MSRAAVFALGHAAGRNSVLNESLDITSEDYVKLLIEQDTELAVHTMHDFFSETLPMLLIGFAIFLFFCFIAWAVAAGWNGLCGRKRCNCAPNYRVLGATLIKFTIYTLGLFTAFGYVGIDFGNMVLSIGIAAGLILSAASAVISNAFSGIVIQLEGKYVVGTVISLPSSGVDKSKIVDFHFLAVEVEEMGERVPEKPPIRFLVPNSHFADGVVQIYYEQYDSGPQLIRPTTFFNKVSPHPEELDDPEVNPLLVDYAKQLNQRSKQARQVGGARPFASAITGAASKLDFSY